MKTIIKLLDYLETAWSVFLLVAILGVMTLQIICRYFFQSPLSWPEELAVLLACYLTFVGISLVHRRHGHMTFSILADGLPPLGRKVVSIAEHLITIAVFLLIVAASIQLEKMQANFLYFAALPITKNYFTLPVTICGVSMTINSLGFLWDELRKEAE